MQTHYGHYFKKASHIIEQRMRRDTVDLTSVQSFMLKYLAIHNDRCMQNELESIFGFRRSSASNLIQVLEKDGYIERESVEEDKRLKVIHLTEKGKEKILSIDKAIERLENELIKDIKTEDLAVFEKVCEKMISNMKGEEL